MNTMDSLEERPKQFFAQIMRDAQASLFDMRSISKS